MPEVIDSRQIYHKEFMAAVSEVMPLKESDPELFIRELDPYLSHFWGALERLYKCSGFDDKADAALFNLVEQLNIKELIESVKDFMFERSDETLKGLKRQFIAIVPKKMSIPEAICAMKSGNHPLFRRRINPIVEQGTWGRKILGECDQDTETVEIKGIGRYYVSEAGNGWEIVRLLAGANECEEEGYVYLGSSTEWVNSGFGTSAPKVPKGMEKYFVGNARDLCQKHIEAMARNGKFRFIKKKH